MRVLLPLKKKLNDPNSSESTIPEDELFDSETGEYFDDDDDDDGEEDEDAADEDDEVEVEEESTTGEAQGSGTEEGSTENESLISPESPDLTTTETTNKSTSGDTAVPLCKALSTATAVSEGVATSTPASATASALDAAGQATPVGHSKTAVAAAAKSDVHTTQVLKGDHTPTKEPVCATRDHQPNNQNDGTNQQEAIAPVVAEGTLSPDLIAEQGIDSIKLQPPTICLPSAASGSSTAALNSSTPTAAVAVAATRIRKRRSPSPLACLDSKPPSKKTKDTKPPARETLPKEKRPALPLTPGSNSTKANMTGASRGGRQLWSGGVPSYFVETANNNNNGRDDVVSSSNNDDDAEVEVRYAYRRDTATTTTATTHNNNEHDPASTARTSVSRTPVQLAARGTRNNNFKTSNSVFHHDGGRDDVDVREQDSVISERPDDREDHLFALALKKQGLEIVEQEGDGNCLFRAISLQVYGDASMHEEVRHRCLEFMARDKEHFSQFITDEPFEQYIRRKRQDGVHGNNPEIQAISELFNRPIEVFVPENGATPLNIFHAEYKTQDAPIRLSYHDGNHYNAVIDPLVPTAGLGLGLPGLQPGLADKMQVAKAVEESDRLADQREFERALEESNNDQLQRAIKESTLSVDAMYQYKALSLSDCDATNFELEQAVLESSLESFRTFEHGRKQASSSSSGAAGRRKRQAGPSQQSRGSQGAGSSSFASIQNEARQDTVSNPMIPRAASAAAASVAAAPPVASRPSNEDNNSHAAAAAPMMAEYYPQTVQELVMNGFELRRVVHAYELVGDNFDDLLSFLMSNGGP